jgi:hypothetical protein
MVLVLSTCLELERWRPTWPIDVLVIEAATQIGLLRLGNDARLWPCWPANAITPLHGSWIQAERRPVTTLRWTHPRSDPSLHQRPSNPSEQESAAQAGEDIKVHD